MGKLQWGMIGGGEGSQIGPAGNFAGLTARIPCRAHDAWVTGGKNALSLGRRGSYQANPAIDSLAAAVTKHTPIVTQAEAHIDEFIHSVAEKVGFVPASHTFEIDGTCKSCAKAA